nr:MAG TPA: hypothetical protein [Caudoviricetes sp.]
MEEGFFIYLEIRDKKEQKTMEIFSFLSVPIRGRVYWYKVGIELV